MDHERCRILLKVLETGSLSAAAEKTGYTPSGVSRAVAALEEEAGFRLLYRSREGAAATPECEELLPVIKQIVFWGDRFYEKAGSIRGVETGSITIGSVYGTFYGWMAELMAGFSKEHPGIEIKTIEGTSSGMCGLMEDRQADFCIVSRRTGDFRFIPLLEDEMMALLPPGHPLAKNKTVPVTAFEKWPVIEFFTDQETDNRNIYKRNNITPNIRYTTMDLQAGYAMAEAGLGICMGNRVTARRIKHSLEIRSLRPRQFNEIGIVIPNEDAISPAAAAFADYALSHKPEWLDAVR